VVQVLAKPVPYGSVDFKALFKPQMLMEGEEKKKNFSSFFHSLWSYGWCWCTVYRWRMLTRLVQDGSMWSSCTTASNSVAPTAHVSLRRSNFLCMWVCWGLISENC